MLDCQVKRQAYLLRPLPGDADPLTAEPDIAVPNTPIDGGILFG